ncbi:MAG: phage major tail protein family [Rickettsiaceae bacterium]|jgi:TP901-1 family phage major tail protein|nr:phage major tail protein family [Rickettsiaceae bacterium]
MTAQKGDNVILKVGNGATPTEAFTTIGGLRNTSFKLNNMIKDASNLASGRWRKLTGAGIESVSIKADGFFTDSAAEETFRGYAFAATVNNYELAFGNGDKLSGAFVVSEYERNGDLRKPEEFSLVLESAGAVTFTVG